MFFFEFNDNINIKKELKFDDRPQEKKLIKFEEYSQSNDILHFKIDCTNSEVTCRQFQFNDSYFILLCACSYTDVKEVVLSLYSQSESIWIHTWDIYLTQLLCKEGINVDKMIYYDYYSMSNIMIVVFRSQLSLHVARIYVTNNTLAEILTFPIESVFHPQTSNIPDLIISHDDTISLLLIEQTGTNSAQYCPTVTELQLVLSRRLLSGVQSLLTFWSRQIQVLEEYTKSRLISLIHGIPIKQYINFIHIHHAILLQVIRSYCESDMTTHSVSNIFIEHLTNMINGYINETMNILTPLLDFSNSNDDEILVMIARMVDMLSENARSYRDLVLVTRWTLGVYQRLTLSKPITKTIMEDRLEPFYDAGNPQSIDQSTMVSECLKTREVASMQLYSMERTGSVITDTDIISQSELIILSNVQSCDWTELNDLVIRLGYPPNETLTALCYETKSKGTRDYLYYHLDLERSNLFNKTAKNFVDQLEMAYTINDSEITNPSFYFLLSGREAERQSSNSRDQIQAFVNGLDKSKCRQLRQILAKSKSGNPINRQLININLNYFLNLLKETDDGDEFKSRVSDAVGLCLIDADYRKLLMESKDNKILCHDRLIVWIYKWRKNVKLFVRYLTESCNADLIKTVVDIDVSTDNVIGGLVIDQLTSMLSETDDKGLYTEVDKHIAKEIMLHILIQYPEVLIPRLEQYYGNDVSKAKDTLLMIDQTLPAHLMCQSQGCLLKKAVMKESTVLNLVNGMFIEKVMARNCDSKFPIVFYYLLKDTGAISDMTVFNGHSSTRKAALLHLVVRNRQPNDMFNSLLSRDIASISDDVSSLTVDDLDEIAYTALISGISCNDIMESSNSIIVGIRKSLNDGNYWHILKTRPLRRVGSDSRASNIEQYYEVNLYNFLHRSGIPLPLDQIFVNQPQNGFANKMKGDQSLAPPVPLPKKHTMSIEPSKESLNYIYYLSLGRPFQAFCCIENEFTVTGKQGCVQLDVMKDLVKSIYQMALSNIDDRLIIGGCFGLLRLIGSRTQLLRCYLTLIQWIIDWHVQINDQSDLSESTQTQLTESEVRGHYATKTMALFKFCLSNNSIERKNSRDLLIRQIEEIFIWRLQNDYYHEIKEILPAWNLVLYFCQMHGGQFSTAILQYYASEDQWLMFLCMSQVFGYSKDQVKEALNQFKDVSIRQHMSYIVNKVDDLSQSCLTPVATEDGSQIRKTTTDPFNKLNPTMPSISVTVSSATAGNSDLRVPTESPQSKDFLSYKFKNHNKYSLSALRNSAKTNLFELIFDCQIDSKTTLGLSQDRSRVKEIRLNIRKMLAYCLALGHPFLSVLAFSSLNDEPLETSTGNRLDVYRNCVSSFIVSSAPKIIQETIWTKWSGVAKLDWSEEDLIDLAVFAIENGFVNVVSQAFTVLKADKFTAAAAFFGMVSHAMESVNPIRRDLFLMEFVNDCKLNSTFVTTKDRLRGKSTKNTTLTFVSRLFGTSLITAMQVIQKRLGVRLLYEWLLAMSSSTSGLLESHVKLLYIFSETNISLLTIVLSVYFDFIDLDSSSQMVTQFKTEIIPVNTKSKDFMQFVENLINGVLEKLSYCYDYTRMALVESTLALVEQINSLHSIQLPSNHDKWKSNESKLRSILVSKVDSDLVSAQTLMDLVSLALAGHTDKIEAVSLCTRDCKFPSPSIDKNISSVNDSVERLHGSSDSWRRLVMPEEWQDRILNLPICTNENNIEKISHVCSLLDGKKWIEACSYMVEFGFSVKDAIVILTSMKVASGKLDPNKLPLSIKDLFPGKYSDTVSEKDPVGKLHVRRMSMQFNTSASRLNLMLSSDSEQNLSKITRQSRSNDACQQYLTKVSDLLIHGLEIMEYICTLHCVATKMSESYMSVASGEEFDVLTKILVGACRDKINTADMYLGVVEIDTDQLCNFIADILVQVLRLEIQTYIGSTSLMGSTSYQKSLSPSPRRPGTTGKLPLFGLSPAGSARSSRSSSPNTGPRRLGTTAQSQNSAFSLHENILRIAERCQLRSEWRTVPAMKSKPESRLMKAFTLQDILLLSPNSRKLGKILFSHYQRFCQEVSACIEDAEFLVHLLIQCHNCFTEGGDTIGISNCLKAAKELTKLLNSSGYFVLMAQLLCRIGRYGEMPYIFSNLIENHEFETLFRKDMDKDGVIVPYIFDYLNRYHSDDFEKIEMVCLKYNCYYELAEMKSKMANLSISKLKEQLGVNCVRETVRMLMSSIINCLLHACKSYLRAGCYKKMEEHFRRAQFYKLQQKWLEDPDKTFTVGPFSRPGRLSSGKMILPETGLPYGVRIISLTSEQAMIFLKKIPSFYTAYIVSGQLKLSGDIWIELLMHHALINGDEAYLRDYILYFGPVIPCNLVQQCLNRLDRSSVKLTTKHGLGNLKLMLTHSDDVFFAKRISETYKLNT